MVERKSKIIVVDDEPDVVQTLLRFLSSKGYDVKGALSAEEAFEILNHDVPDAILLDVFMPGCKGTEVARIVKCKYPQTKVVIITAYPRESEKLYKESNYDTLFIKPLRIDDLYAKVEEILRQNEPPEERTGITTHKMNIKARIVCLGISGDNAVLLRSRLQELQYQGEEYHLEFATDEKMFFKRIVLFHPDIVIVDKAYYQKKGRVFNELCLKLPGRSFATLICNVDAALYEYQECVKLVRAIRDLCIKNGLFSVACDKSSSSLQSL